MTMGPLEFVEIEFEGNHLTGEILPELQALHSQGIIRVVDLVLMQKDQDGTLTVREISDLSEEEAKAFAGIAGGLTRLLSPEDIEDAAANMPNNSAAAIALLEHLWAIHLKETIIKAQGHVLAAGLISQDEIEALEAELEAQSITVPH